MNADELRNRLESMPEPIKVAMKTEVGLVDRNDEDLVRIFQLDPGYERRTCVALGVPTEADRVGQANIASARYSRLAIVIAIVSLIVSIIAILK